MTMGLYELRRLPLRTPGSRGTRGHCVSDLCTQHAVVSSFQDDEQSAILVPASFVCPQATMRRNLVMVDQIVPDGGGPALTTIVEDGSRPRLAHHAFRDSDYDRD